MATTKTPTFVEIFENNKYDLKTSAKKSRAWFNQQVLLLNKKNITPNKLMQGANLKARIIPGNLYMFVYDPKLKESLPYYDRFPLVFPYAATEDGFMGLNMHYLPYQLRVQLLDRLMVFKNNAKMDETTRIKYSWSLIAGVSKFRAAEPCIKRYLLPNIKSRIIKVESKEWDTALFLPVHQFKKTKVQTVWKESVEQIRNS